LLAHHKTTNHSSHPLVVFFAGVPNKQFLLKLALVVLLTLLDKKILLMAKKNELRRSEKQCWSAASSKE